MEILIDLIRYYTKYLLSIIVTINIALLSC